MYSVSRRDEEILLTIWDMKDDAYLVGIRNKINEITGKELTIGAIHIPLTKLEQEGIITSQMGEATSKRGGRRKRIYSITAKGIEVLKESRRNQNVFWEGFTREFSI